jgi:signal transduction histidine kinase
VVHEHENSMFVPMPEYFNPALLLKETISMFKHDLKMRKAKLRFFMVEKLQIDEPYSGEYQEGYTLPNKLFGDGERMTQIFVSLLQNAFKHTLSVNLLIVVISFDEKRNLFIGQVTDQGVGVSPSMQEEIFDLWGKRFRSAE